MTHTQTPWGLAQTEKVIAAGITRYDTASHGGYHLTLERQAEMPADLRGYEPWAGPGWYEEDCDWAIVCLAFPEYFPPESYRFAVDTLRDNPNLLTPERVARADAWTAANQDKFCKGCEGTQGGGWWVNAVSVGQPELRLSKVFPGIPLLPGVFTREQFENAELYRG